MDTFLLECGEKGLHRRIIVTVSRSTHTDFDPFLFQTRLIPHTGVFAAPVGMMQQRKTGALRVAASQRHPQGQRHQLLVFCAPHGPAHHAAGIQIKHHCQIQPSFLRRDHGAIGHPFGIGRLSREVTIEQVRSKSGVRVAFRALLYFVK